MRTLLKVVGGVTLALILLGALFDGLLGEGPSGASTKNGSDLSGARPPVSEGTNPRFHGPGHPMYGKNYYQAADEVLNEMQQAGYNADQIKMAFIAMEATKCATCNGYGSRGGYRCLACKGDGVLEN